MKLDTRTIELIAVGASVSANCQPCLQVNFRKAVESGADPQEIAEAMQIGRMVRKGAASEIDELASELCSSLPAPAQVTERGCGCAAPDRTQTGGKDD